MKWPLLAVCLGLVACDDTPSPPRYGQIEHKMCTHLGAQPNTSEYNRCRSEIAATQAGQDKAIMAMWAERQKHPGAAPISIPTPAIPPSVPNAEHLCDYPGFGELLHRTNCYTDRDRIGVSKGG
jgi:hypothetical protein